MKIYKLYESENSRFTWLKGCYLTMESAKENAKSVGKSKHLELVDGKFIWVDDVYTYKIEEIKFDNPMFDIYIERVSDGHRISNLTYDKANELFEKYSNNMECIHLQLQMAQFDGIGVTTIKKHKTEEFEKAQEEYYERLEEEENEKFYSPSCPWNAPGMSIKDFI